MVLNVVGSSPTSHPEEERKFQQEFPLFRCKPPDFSDGEAPAKVIAKVNEWIDLHETEIPKATAPGIFVSRPPDAAVTP